MSKTTYENQFLVFDVRDGPKVIIEQLNAFGQDGWVLSTMLNVGDTQIVAFLARGNVKDAPNPKQSEQQKIANLWTTGDKKDKDE
jgi:hypothetical protein